MPTSRTGSSASPARGSNKENVPSSQRQFSSGRSSNNTTPTRRQSSNKAIPNDNRAGSAPPYANWRETELCWLQEVFKSVHDTLPEDLIVDENAPTVEDRIRKIWGAEYCHPLLTASSIDQRMLWRRVLAEDDELHNQGTICTLSPQGSITAEFSCSPTPSASSSRLSHATPAGEFKWTAASLRRIFADFYKMREAGDVQGELIVESIVKTMLSVRIKKVHRNLLRAYLDDILEVLQVSHPTLSCRRKCAFTNPHRRGVSGLDRDEIVLSENVSKYCMHLAAVEDLLDVLLVPCHDEKFFGVLEFTSRLNAMTAVQILDDNVIGQCCDALRRRIQTAAGADSETCLLLWKMIAEAVERVAAYVASYVDGDGEMSDDDTSLLPQSPSAASDGWQTCLADAVGESRLIGCVCIYLTLKSVDVAICRQASLVLHRLMTDVSTREATVETASQFPEVLEYLCAAVHRGDEGVETEIADSVAMMLTVQESTFNGGKDSDEYLTAVEAANKVIDMMVQREEVSVQLLSAVEAATDSLRAEIALLISAKKQTAPRIVKAVTVSGLMHVLTLLLAHKCRSVFHQSVVDSFVGSITALTECPSSMLATILPALLRGPHHSVIIGFVQYITRGLAVRRNFLSDAHLRVVRLFAAMLGRVTVGARLTRHNGIFRGPSHKLLNAVINQCDGFPWGQE